MKRILLLFLVAVCTAGLAAGQSTGSPTTAYAQGRRAQVDGNNYRAIELYKQALQENPLYLQPIAGLAETYFALGEFSEALRYVQRAEKLDAGSVRLVNLEGRIRIGLGEFATAKKLFDEVLHSQPNNIESKFGLAEISVATGEPSAAAASFENALSIAPENKRALLSLVLLYDSTGDYQKAEQYTRLALQYHSNDPQVHYVAAEHYAEVKNYPEALKQAETSLSLQPDNVDATLLLSEIDLRMQRYDKVVPLITSILAKNSSDYLLWYTLGLAYEKLGKVDESIRSFSRAFSIRPDDQISRIALERELIDSPDMKDPRRAQYAQYHFDQGKLYEQRNYLDRALREYRRGLRIDPYSAGGRLSFAKIYNTQGYPAKYLFELKALEKTGKASSDVKDRIAIESNFLQDSVSNTWGVDQFTLHREPYVLSIFYTTQGKMVHELAQGILAKYFHYLMEGYQNISHKGQTQETSSFADAFRSARDLGSDYFLILQFNESQRYFRVTADLYSSSSGSEIDSQQSYRTGNSRVTDALANVASGIHAVLPLRGRLLNRRFDSGLIDLGRIDGVKKGDKLLIIRNGSISLAKNRPGFDYPSDAVIGTFDITKTDALVSEGTVTSNQFFDLINPRDWVILPPPKSQQPAQTTPPPGELYRNFLKLSGG